MNRNKKTKNIKQNKAIDNIAEKGANMGSSKEVLHNTSPMKGK